MSELKNKITKKPVYSFQKTEDGKTRASWSVEIEGKTFSTTVVGRNESDAMNLLRARYDKTLRNSEYSSLIETDVDSSIGSNPKQVSPAQMLARQTSSPQEDSPANTLGVVGPEGETLSRRGETFQVEENPSAMVKGKPKNHVPYTDNFLGIGSPQDGIGDSELDEPNPAPFERPGDHIIQGSNNTLILLGRDSAPQNSQTYSNSLFSRKYNSGFSDHMGAGAIDIVVGRMAPFPLEEINGSPIVLGPSFNTSFPPEVKGISLTGGNHPGMVMDAARIYISQMTIIDKNFKVTERIRSGDEDTNEVAPTSGIMIKADKLRMHSRQDLKIVTGGPDESWNSQGNRIKRNNGIHLIAENGTNRDGESIPQHPMVLGDNLVECLKSILKLVEQVNRRLDNFVAAQNKFNATTSTAFDLLPIPSAVTIQNPYTTWTGLLTVLEGVNNRLDGLKIDVNNFNRITNYLNENSEVFINSRHNTVN
jgi:hypothetical protein